MTELFHFIYIQPKWLVCVVAIGAVLVWGIIARLCRRDAAYYKTFRVIAAALFLIAVFGILYRTLFNRTETIERTISLIPFHADAFYTCHAEYPRMLIMNAVLFVPFGMTLPFVIGERAKRPVLTTIIIAAALSFVIEVVQYIFAIGNSEIDDLLMNTLGAAIGTLSYVIGRVRRSRNRE